MKNFRLLSRTVTVLLAAILLSFTVPEAVFAQETECGVKNECGTKTERSGKPRQRRTAQGRTAQAVFTGLSPVAIPFASDETEQGQAYLAASAGSRSVRIASLRKLLFIQNAELAYAQSFARNASCTSNAGGIFDDLFVIHYIHNQDGAKS